MFKKCRFNRLSLKCCQCKEFERCLFKADFRKQKNDYYKNVFSKGELKWEIQNLL